MVSWLLRTTPSSRTERRLLMRAHFTRIGLPDDLWLRANCRLRIGVGRSLSRQPSCCLGWRRSARALPSLSKSRWLEHRLGRWRRRTVFVVVVHLAPIITIVGIRLGLDPSLRLLSIDIRLERGRGAIVGRTSTRRRFPKRMSAQQTRSRKHDPGTLTWATEYYPTLVWTFSNINGLQGACCCDAIAPGVAKPG